VVSANLFANIKNHALFLFNVSDVLWMRGDFGDLYVSGFFKGYISRFMGKLVVIDYVCKHIIIKPTCHIS